MLRKKYLISIVETKTEKAYSAYISKSKGIFLFFCLLILFIAITLPLSHLLIRGKDALKIYQLKKENNVLQKKFNAIQARSDTILIHIKQLKNENQKINSLFANTSSNIQYGVGGQEITPSLNNFNHPVITKTEIELSKIEKEVDWLSKSISHLNSNISSKMNKISHYPSIRPTRKGWVSSTFGKRKDPFTNKIVDHPGIDICTEIGTNIIATGDGKVIAIRKDFIENKGYGKFILIDHGFGYKTLYAHLSKISVKKGQNVKRWDIIGLTGNSGKSTSPHLHYGVFHNGKPQDPYNFILE